MGRGAADGPAEPGARRQRLPDRTAAGPDPAARLLGLPGLHRWRGLDRPGQGRLRRAGQQRLQPGAGRPGLPAGQLPGADDELVDRGLPGRCGQPGHPAGAVQIRRPVRPPGRHRHAEAAGRQRRWLHRRDQRDRHPDRRGHPAGHARGALADHGLDGAGRSGLRRRLPRRGHRPRPGVPRAVGRLPVRRGLHGDRLRDQPHHAARHVDLRPGHRPADAADPPVRRPARGRDVLDPADERGRAPDRSRHPSGAVRREGGKR